MDDKKKFEIEFEDDFDAWLAKHDEEKAKAAAPVPVTAEPAEQPQEVYSDNSAADIPVSRQETVKNFKLNIDESILDEPVVTEPEKPKNKAIYFASRQPSKAQLEHRRAQEEARQLKQRQEKQQRAKQRKKESEQVVRLRRALVCIVVVLTSVLASMYCISCINDVLAINRDDELVTVEIEKDADYKEIIDVLGDNGLIKHEWFCKLMTKFRHFDDKTYINGIHYLTADMGVEGMLTAMRENRTSGETIRLSFPEGWTIPQIIEKLAANDVCPEEYLYDALAKVEFDYGFVGEITNDGSKAYYLEGYMFPDTYDFFVSDKAGGIGENPNSVIRKFLANFEMKWSEVYEKRAQELGYTMDEIIIIASIIQKEAADQSQMADVSSVIHNRLNNPSSYPTLGCDSTKKYVTNHLVKELGAAKANTYMSGYDTNSTRAGLPAGPICNPGVAAIEAALNPSDTNYFYFCHNENGKIYLASTYSQFQANWAQVLKDNEG
ncbi:MAG: endolytic transglycosylase MltG [Clostridia bacterium]|nr:endolytic transglycosylase MltG [Clostridia bacterium]